jgi:hypothetical protein
MGDHPNDNKKLRPQIEDAVPAMAEHAAFIQSQRESMVQMTAQMQELNLKRTAEEKRMKEEVGKKRAAIAARRAEIAEEQKLSAERAAQRDDQLAELDKREVEREAAMAQHAAQFEALQAKMQESLS